ncbi:MAG: glutamate--tRNA ligase [bacterium]|nr:glutamate--tRNA ligase [bacterium]
MGMNIQSESPRVRFAPSPTGHLHVGHVRTALYNFLLAKGTGGAYILRIEDTDVERSTPESLRAILAALRWLGLDWDEGPDVGGPCAPYLQSERYDFYREAAQRLLDSGAAYPCFCSPEELDAERDKAHERKEAYRYSGRCRGLDRGEAHRRMDAGEPYAVRFAVPAGEPSEPSEPSEASYASGKTAWVEPTQRGRVSFADADIEDFIIWRRPSVALGHPLYNFTVTVDDVAMRITHVLRGDDHISNTPKQILLYRALGAEPPVFIHLPMILGPDRQKLSKRHGATSLAEFRRLGYLPEGLVNYLALLGWNEGTERELYTLDELTAAFSTERISNTAAVFDYDKCRYVNGEHLRMLPPEERARRALDHLREAGALPGDIAEGSAGWGRLVEIVDRIGDRPKLLGDYDFYVRPFYLAPETYDAEAVKKVLGKEGVCAFLTEARRLFDTTNLEHDALEEAFRAKAEELGVGLGKLVQPVRVALTGGTVGIGLFETVVLLGREETLARIDACLGFIGER